MLEMATEAADCRRVAGVGDPKITAASRPRLKGKSAPCVRRSHHYAIVHVVQEVLAGPKEVFLVQSSSNFLCYL
jgi:hypothetical protein